MRLSEYNYYRSELSMLLEVRFGDGFQDYVWNFMWGRLQDNITDKLAEVYEDEA